MSRPNRPHIVRFGRDASLAKVMAACNADAERMRREREQRAKSDQPAPVVVGKGRGQ